MSRYVGDTSYPTMIYAVTTTGSKLHYAQLCESLYDFHVSADMMKPDARLLTPHAAARWLAADPRRGRCGRCHPPMPYGPLAAVR